MAKKAKSHGVKLEGMGTAQLMQLSKDIKKVLASTLAKREKELEKELAGLRAIARGSDEIAPRATKGGKGGGGKRERATAEEVEARVAKVLAALKGTAKGKGLKRSEIMKKTGLSKEAVGITLGMMKKDKKKYGIDKEGVVSNTTWFLG